MNRIGFAILMALSLFSHMAYAQGRPSPRPAAKVRWTENIPAAIKQRRETGRPLIVYVTAEYCGYCHKMERETWSDPKIAQRIQDGFVALKVDAELHEELVQRLGVEGLPTTIVFDSAGQRIQTLSGYVRPRAVMDALDAVPALDPAAAAVLR